MKLTEKEVISHLKRSIAALKHQNEKWSNYEEDLPIFAKNSQRRQAIREVCLDALLKNEGTISLTVDEAKVALAATQDYFTKVLNLNHFPVSVLRLIEQVMYSIDEKIKLSETKCTNES